MEKTFKNITEAYPNLSSYMCFVKLVKFGKIKKSTLRKYFNKFVETGDYLKSEKEALIKDLVLKIPKI